MKKLVNKELIIGISVICALVILYFGIEYLKGINMLSPSNFYYVYYKNVNGLEVSAPVSVDGFKVGKVREISYDFDNPGKVKVLLAVDKKLKVPEDSYAVLSSTLMGGGYIDIRMGRSTNMLEKGSEIPTKSVPGLMDALSDNVMPAVSTILPRVDSLLINLNTLVADPALSASIKRLDGITANVENATVGLDRTMRTDVPAVMRNARNATTKIDSLCVNLVGISETIKALPLTKTMDNVYALSDNLQKFSNQLNSTNSTLGQLTNDPELYNKLNRVAADIDSLVVDIKKNPKRYISIKLL